MFRVDVALLDGPRAGQLYQADVIDGTPAEQP